MGMGLDLWATGEEIRQTNVENSVNFLGSKETRVNKASAACILLTSA